MLHALCLQYTHQKTWHPYPVISYPLINTTGLSFDAPCTVHGGMRASPLLARGHLQKDCLLYPGLSMDLIQQNLTRSLYPTSDKRSILTRLVHPRPRSSLRTILPSTTSRRPMDRGASGSSWPTGSSFDQHGCACGRLLLSARSLCGASTCVATRTTGPMSVCGTACAHPIIASCATSLEHSS